MSIKGFHLIFIAIAALFCAGCGVRAIFLDEQSTGSGVKVFGGITLVASVVLIVYGFYFRRKSKDIIV
jgi:succinate dehydrogenase hydrophobic anchor subunit